MASSLYSPVVQLPVPYINGLVPSWVSASTLQVSPGSCWIKDPQSGTYTFSVSVTAPLVLDASVNGVNGLDTGTLANSSFYYLYLIADAQGFNLPALLLSLSPAQPVLPVGALYSTTYNIFRQIGFVATDGSANLLKFYTSGTNSERTHFWDIAPNVLSSGNATIYTNIDLFTTSLAVPKIDNTAIYLQSEFTPATAGNSANFTVPASSSVVTNTITGQVATVEITEQYRILSKLVVGIPSIQYKVSSSSDSLELLVIGFDYCL